jgi:adenine-specific DNA-methyltransferase
MGTGSFSSAISRAVGSFSFAYPERADRSEILSGKVAELMEVGAFGGEEPRNRLYAGDNLNILRALCNDETVRGKARLVYIDPPYATGFAFESATVGAAYLDHIQGADYIESLRQRVILLPS